MKSSRGKHWGFALILLGAIDILSYAVIQNVLGGNAQCGKSNDGKFFLGRYDSFKPVSQDIFLYSLIHGYLALLGAPLLFIGALYNQGSGVIRQD